jgi:CelD/BcsL family acetyltransferase involved in cellulose biosynthesis
MIQEVTSVDQLECIGDEWNDLVAQSGTTNPFLSWEWVAAWSQHMARGPLNILVVRREGKALGILPLERVSYKLPFGIEVPTLQMIGRGSHQYELREIICLPGHEREVLRSGILHLVGDQRQWYCVVLDGFVEGSEAYRIANQLGENRSSALRGENVVSHILDLPDSWEALRGRLKRNIKESLRHCYNSLKREGRTYSFEVWDEIERLPEALDIFLRLHSDRARQQSSVRHDNYFETAVEQRFLHSVAAPLLKRGICHPAFLRVDSEIVAARLMLEMGGQIYLYYSGFDQRWWEYSVSTTITAECIKWAINRGLSAVNLSAGSDVSKTRWGGRVLDQHSVVLLSNGWLPRAALAAYSAIGRRDPERWKRLLGAEPGTRRRSRLVPVLRRPGADA